MKKLCLMMLLLSTQVLANDLCQQITSDYALNDSFQSYSSETAYFSRREWAQTPVLFDFEYDSCVPTESVNRTLLKNKEGVVLEQITTNDDVCDGGNSYGIIRNAETEEVVAHIYDSFVYCKEDWRK